MNKQDATRLIDETFNNPFDEIRFRLFIKNLFNEIDESKSFECHGPYIPDAYKEHIKQYKRIGKYIDPEGVSLDVLIIHLKKESALDRARNMQRNFVARYLKQRGEKDVAVAAFFSDESEDWRFSYVRMDYKLEQTDSGKVKVKEDLTPARRYSFLVGKNEPKHTAQQQLVPLLADDYNNPTIMQLEQAFNIESVTREFFDKYKELFLKLKDELDRIADIDKKIADEFTGKQINTTDFAKKLMGQIVFLYFLQKKGWLGIGKDESGNFRNWGTGPKNFLRKLFDRKIVDYDNFFNDILEPLFYEVLATDRGKESFHSRFNCKIPFLNGGLFEPIGGYNWQATDILLENRVFTDIFDTFDLYNFTVREDEPLEKEVAVDPEMLGKVFENLLEVKDRKSKGAFYTPREIVHYICKESLIGYLSAEPAGNIAGKDIREFIYHGDLALDNDAAKEQGTITYSYKMPESIRMNAKLIDHKLADIKICDPAIGSGAFPLGMLNEIVKARTVLTTYLSKKAGRTPYNFKRHAIQESIYGVDIDPSAVDIAKLRLWLSLVVDEDDYLSIKPLPNLDYKIMQGDSLVEEFEGIRLFDEKMIIKNGLDNGKEIEKAKERENELQRHYIQLHSTGNLSEIKKQMLTEQLQKQKKLIKNLTAATRKKTENTGLFDTGNEARRKAEELRQLHSDFFEETQTTKKEALKKRIEQLEWELIEATLKEQGKTDSLKKIAKYRKSSTRPFFLWRLHFAEVFQGKGGFDVVIGNPPYVRQEALGNLKPYFQKHYNVYHGTADLYVYFIERGVSLLKTNGMFGYIVGNKWLRANYGEPLRHWMKNQHIEEIIDFGDLPVFQTATTYPCILRISRKPPGQSFNATQVKTLKFSSLDGYVHENCHTVNQSDLDDKGWSLPDKSTQALLVKLRNVGVPLGEYVNTKIYRGVLTGLNEAFIIDAKTRNELIVEDYKSEELIKPFLAGKDIKRYQKLVNDRYLIVIPNGWTRKSSGNAPNKWKWFQGNYPAVAKHLAAFDTPAAKRQDKGEYWWELRPCDYYTEFEKPKIMLPDISIRGNFTLDCQEFYYCANTAYIISSKDKYLLGVLNSKLISCFYKNLSSTYRGGYLRFIYQYLIQLPIRRMNFSSLSEKTFHDKLVDLVEQMLELNKRLSETKTDHEKDVFRYQIDNTDRQIDRLVYELYGLTEEEIRIVEESVR
jgi:hypothetical protein